MMIRLRMDFCD